MSEPLLTDSTVTVRVPATSANLGPGFDALGLALAWYDDVAATVVPSGLHIDVEGEGADGVSRDESHLVVRAMRITFERLGARPTGLRLTCTNRIPHGRGLGSSAAAIVAGVLLARGLVEGGDTVLDDAAVLALSSDIEGHPDNVAACLLGGLTIAWSAAECVSGIGSGGARAIRLEPSGIWPVVCIPSTSSSTEVARQALPATVPHVDAAFNAARAALLIAAMTGAPEHLLTATDDRLHQPYRADRMRPSAELVAVLRAHGVAAVVSGAGPTVLALTRAAAESEPVQSLVPAGWRVEAVPVAERGAHLL